MIGACLSSTYTPKNTLFHLGAWGEAASLPNVPALGEGVCQNVLKELRGCCVHSAHALPLALLKY